MKLNQELLNRIKSRVAAEHFENDEAAYWDLISDFAQKEYWPEVCCRYSEQIIKCTECEGTGEHEINVDGMDAPSADGCMFCEGKGYIDEKV